MDCLLALKRSEAPRKSHVYKLKPSFVIDHTSVLTKTIHFFFFFNKIYFIHPIIKEEDKIPYIYSFYEMKSIKFLNQPIVEGVASCKEH